ncbi:cation-translocating P-type ATPase [Eudoraea adriatica]|uniref:cation-translocating P-type ATPase n=1 Tax=Eudoraea adriatica TaxID=446681 RepID=UPI00037E39CF|nr:cation-transporting P-type ATPase [Eudoraea adriatica]
MVQAPCSFSVQEIADKLNSNLSNGLDRETVLKHRQTFGPNQILQDGPKKRWKILADQFIDPIIYILTAAAILAFLFSDLLEGFAIVIVIFISVAIGFFMELQAVRSLEALRKLGQVMTSVIRSGKKHRIKAASLVPGDIVLLETGDVVSADARLIEIDSLSVKESSLTGESIPVSKDTAILSEKTPVTDQKNMVFRGTTIVTGSGSAIITATGQNTELGKIQQMGVMAEKEATPLEKKLKQLGKWLIWLTLIFVVLIVIAGIIRGRDIILMIETGVALAVAAIPEGLPIVATIALAQGMLQLAKKQVVIKKLEAVQSLGATNIICTDKTGTLTEDKIKVHTVVIANTTLTNVTQYKAEEFNIIKKNEAFNKMMLTSILCNNVIHSGYRLQSDSIEIGLLDFADQAGYDIKNIQIENPEKLELPFDANRKLMATVNLGKDGYHVYAKGAFEKLVQSCTHILEEGQVKSFETKKEWYRKVDDLASQGFRTLAFAYRKVEKIPEKESLTNGLTFLGVIGFMDPPRKDVKAIIDIYKKAGINVIMVTGDHPKTAQKVAEEVGLLEPRAPGDKVMEGKDLQSMKLTEEMAGAPLLEAAVFARVTPRQKLDLITMYQKNANIVGMIGDGINDVPALKKADVGIAMGIRGTEAAREVADVILMNDKFTAIEMAIRQGRVVLQNIRQFAIYLLSCNLAEILSVGVAALLNLPSPLLPLQILFLNLVTDVFPALALGLGKGEEDIMEQPPRDPKEPILTRKDWYATMVYGLSISASVIGIVVYASFVLKLNWDIINNMAFYTLVFAQLFNVFNMPKRKASFFKNEVTKNGWVWGAIALSVLITLGAYLAPPIAEALSLLPISPEQLGITVLFALGSIVLAQLVKRFRG